MSLLEYIIWTERDELENFKNDIPEILEFLQPTIEVLVNKISELNSKEPNCVWDDTKCIYKTFVITINPKFTNIQDELVHILMTYLDKNQLEWEKKFSHKEWFESKH